MIETQGDSSQVKPIAISDTITNSLFQEHLLEVRNQYAQVHYTKYDYWYFGVLLILYSFLVWMLVSNSKKLSQIIQGFYLTQSTNENNRNEFLVGNRVSVFLSLFFIVTISIFVSELLTHFNVRLFNFPYTEVIIATLLVIVYAVKFTAINALGFVFKVQKEAKEYIKTVFLFCNSLGLFMFPVVIGLLFVKQLSPQPFINLGILLILLSIGVRIVKGVFIGLRNAQFSIFYLFMYLCALEILPFVLLAKIISLRIAQLQ